MALVVQDSNRADALRFKGTIQALHLDPGNMDVKAFLQTRGCFAATCIIESICFGVCFCPDSVMIDVFVLSGPVILTYGTEMPIDSPHSKRIQNKHPVSVHMAYPCFYKITKYTRK